MSDLKCERWSWRDSNSALQVLQVNLGATTATFWEAFSSFIGSSRVSAAEILVLSRDSEIEAIEECRDERTWQESKNCGGRSKIERCRFSCWGLFVFLSVVAAERGTVAMVVDFLDSVSFVKFRGCVLN